MLEAAGYTAEALAAKFHPDSHNFRLLKQSLAKFPFQGNFALVAMRLCYVVSSAAFLLKKCITPGVFPVCTQNDTGPS